MQYDIKLYLLFAFILIESISQQPEQQIPKKRILKSADSITQIKIQFCQSWSFVGYFKEVKHQLEARYQDIEVIPEDYPLKNPRKAIYYSMIGIEILLISIILLSDFIKPKIEKYVPPDIIEIFNENKLAKIAMIFMVGQFIGTIITNTGAFEIFCQDKLIWSTIEHNGVKPNLSTIVKLVKKMKWNWKKMFKLMYVLLKLLIL